MSDQLQSGSPAGFVLRVAAWIVAFFGLLRLPWVQTNVLVPFARFQQELAAALGAPAKSVVVDISCSGSDAMALCVGAIFAFPARWRQRLVGAALGLFVVTVFNTVRIGHVSTLIREPEVFHRYHVYIWPAILIVVAAGFVFMWMSRVSWTASTEQARGQERKLPGLRFGLVSVALVAGYYALLPTLMSSTVIQQAARSIARFAGGAMGWVGVEARVQGIILSTDHGAWAITPECILTPLIPIYLATVLTVPLVPWKKLLGVVAAPLLFALLGTGRLLVLALPAAVIGSHWVAVHAFHQVVLSLLVVGWAAWWGTRRDAAALARRLVPSLAIGAVAGLVLGVAGRWVRLPETLRDSFHLGHGWVDPQGALTLLPSFALAVLVSLMVATHGARALARARRATTGIALVALLGASVFVSWLVGETASHLGEPPVVAIRALSVALPLTVASAWLWALGWRPAQRPAPSTRPAAG